MLLDSKCDDTLTIPLIRAKKEDKCNSHLVGQNDCLQIYSKLILRTSLLGKKIP